MSSKIMYDAETAKKLLEIVGDNEETVSLHLKGLAQTVIDQEEKTKRIQSAIRQLMKDLSLAEQTGSEDRDPVREWDGQELVYYGIKEGDLD